MTAHIVDWLQTWGSFFGILLDILGAFLVYYGVHINITRATTIEQIHQAKLIDDLGDPELLRRNEVVAAERARERVRASNWALVGFVFFLIGFALQAFGAWPKGPN
jgi:hypothetical protein